MFISFLYISSLDFSGKVYLFLSSLFLIRSSMSLVILFKMIVFNLSSFTFSKILSSKNSGYSISWLLMLASEVSRILLGGEFCMYGIISMIDISMVTLFKKSESLLRLILFISLWNCRSLFTLTLRASLVISWKFVVLVTSSTIRSISACWCWCFSFLITYKIVLFNLINSLAKVTIWRILPKNNCECK